MIYLLVFGMCFNCVMAGMALEKDGSQQFVCACASFFILTCIFLWEVKVITS